MASPCSEVRETSGSPQEDGLKERLRIGESFQKSLRCILAFLLLWASSTPVAAQGNRNANVQTSYPIVDLALGSKSGFYPVRPDVLFAADAPLSLFYPETSGDLGINVRNPVMQNMVNAANAQGILYWIGYDTNFSRIFTLYRSGIGADPSEGMASFGGIGLGLGHLPTHDLSHLLFAMVSPRFPGLYDSEGRVVDAKRMREAHRQMTQMLVQTEALASAWTSLQYVMDYMVWANDQLLKSNDASAVEPERFQSELQEMKTLFQFGHMNRKDFVRLTEAQTAGIFVKHENWTKTIYEALRNVFDMSIKIPASADPKAFQRRVEMGMPQVFDLNRTIDQLWNEMATRRRLPSLDPRVRNFAASIALKTISGAAFTIETMYRPFSGAKAFTSGSEEFAAGFLTPWTVEYSHRFRWGMTYAEAQANLDKRKQQLVDNEFFADAVEPATNVTAAMILRNEMVELGRKLIEVKWLGKYIKREPGAPESADMLAEREIQVEFLVRDLLALHDTVYDLAQANRPISNDQLAAWKNQLRAMVDRIEQKLPADQIIPQRHRNPYMKYDHFWRDMFAAVGSPKAGMDSPEKMRAFFNDQLIFERVQAIHEYQKDHGHDKFPPGHGGYLEHANKIAAIYIREVERAFLEHRISKTEREAAFEVYDSRFGPSRVMGDAFAAKTAELIGDKGYVAFVAENRRVAQGKVGGTDTAEQLIQEIQERPIINFVAGKTRGSHLKLESTDPRPLLKTAPAGVSRCEAIFGG